MEKKVNSSNKDRDKDSRIVVFFLGVVPIVMFLSFLFYVFMWPPFYFANSIDAQVVEKDTGKPVDGVNVVAIWILENGFPEAGPSDILKVEEAYTDQNGKFHLDKWGPRFKFIAYLGSYSPLLILYDNNHKIKTLENHRIDGQFRKVVRESDWNHTTIQMKRNSSIQDRLSNAERATNQLKMYLRLGNCDSWKGAQKIMLAIVNEQESLEKMGEDTEDIMSKEFYLSRTRYCGHPEKYFKEVLRAKKRF
jgi:hypothetical protein